MSIEIPEFLLELSKQMSEQPSCGSAHPFWQVRCKRYITTEAGYNEHHWILCDDDGEFYRSDKDELKVAVEHFEDCCTGWFSCRIAEFREEEDEPLDISDIDLFIKHFDFEYMDFPETVTRLHVQEVEEIVTTHLTQVAAHRFIKRKQHDYPKLYTWVESAYWSPQLRELQDWIISLTSSQPEIK